MSWDRCRSGVEHHGTLMCLAGRTRRAQSIAGRSSRKAGHVMHSKGSAAITGGLAVMLFRINSVQNGMPTIREPDDLAPARSAQWLFGELAALALFASAFVRWSLTQLADFAKATNCFSNRDVLALPSHAA